MPTMIIVLPESLKTYVDEQVAALLRREKLGGDRTPLHQFPGVCLWWLTGHRDPRTDSANIEDDEPQLGRCLSRQQ
jgi:hypothetical protein